MERVSVRIFEISDITDTTKPDSIEVLLADTGKRIRFPRSRVQIEYRRIIVEEWLVRKMGKSLRGKEAGA